VSQFLSDYSGNTGKHAIANCVSVLIVYGLEVINIHTYYSQRLVRHTLAFRDSLFKHHIKATGIRQFRERINKRAFLRFLER